MASKLTLSVTQLNNYIKNIFEVEEFLIGISVFGEVSNFKLSGGYAYFDLKEEGAQVSCVMFNTAGLGEVKNGDKVVLTGRMNFHTRLGKLSFVASKLEPYGMGELYKKYLELKEKLQKEGLFDEVYKIALPKFAKRVGVITSETGAVIHDIINVTRRKNPFTDIVLYPVKVQGEGADKEIAKAIAEMDKREDLDVLIVARGGGSFEDLAPFNTEIVARSVFACNKPIISAVGHETDFSLCDFVADMRAPTPSVGAELAVFDYAGIKEKISKNIKRLNVSLVASYDKYIAKLKQYLLSMMSQIENKNTKTISQIRKSLSFVSEVVQKKQTQLETKTQNLAVAIDKQNPMRLIQKGYSKLSADGKVIVSVQSLKPKTKLTNTLLDGEVVSEVIEIKPKETKNGK